MSIREPWAKSQDGETRSIVAHCSDVALTAFALSAKPVMHRRLEAAFRCQLLAPHLHRLAILVGLHDIGKALTGFQNKLIDGNQRIRSGHVAEALAVLSTSMEAQAAVQAGKLSDWFAPVEQALFSSICHHGEPVPMARVSPIIAETSAQLQRTQLGHDPLVVMAELFDALVLLFPEAHSEVKRLTFTPLAQHLFAGLVMLSDWMASGNAFKDGDRTEVAEKTLADTCWSEWHSGAAAARLLGKFVPRPLQTAMLGIDLSKQLRIIEAPTGEGKTEAALIHAVRLVEAGSVDGLYFAVPSRSAAKELHARVSRVMAACHPMLAGKVVRAVPGMIDTDVRPDYAPEPWSISSPKTSFAAPVAVGTIDQAMLSMLRVRHAWLRAACLTRHLLVIDEVHASDPYMSAVIENLITRHTDLGGYVLCLSATLGETMRARM